MTYGVRNIGLMTIAMMFCALQASGQDINAMYINYSNGACRTDTIPLADISSVEFGTVDNMSPYSQEQIRADRIIREYRQLLAIADDTVNIYNNFALNADQACIRGLQLQSGQTVQMNGSGAGTAQIKDGAIACNDNYYVTVRGTTPLTYIGMTFSFAQVDDKEEYSNNVNPVVLILGKEDDPFTHLIHVVLKRADVEVTTRDGDSGFRKCNAILSGTKDNSPQLVLDSIYHASVTLKGDTMYVQKPDGSLYVVQDDYFNGAFPVAMWQAFNLPKYNYNAFIHEIYAGTSTLVDKAWKLKSKK